MVPLLSECPPMFTKQQGSRSVCDQVVSNKQCSNGAYLSDFQLPWGSTCMVFNILTWTNVTMQNYASLNRFLLQSMSLSQFAADYMLFFFFL